MIRLEFRVFSIATINLFFARPLETLAHSFGPLVAALASIILGLVVSSFLPGLRLSLMGWRIFMIFYNGCALVLPAKRQINNY